MRARWLLVSVLCPHPPHPPQPPQVAIKWISKASITDMTEMDRVSREFFILTAIDHRNVIRLYEVLQDDAFLYLVMEFAGGGTLEGLLSSRPGGALLSEASSRALFSEVASAVRYCHRQSIVHRDLKPENILLARTDVAITPDVLATRPQELYTVKVADFGLSNTATVGTRARSPVGTPLFSAPEVLFPSAYPSLWADGGAAVAGGGPVAEEEEEGADAATPAPAPAPAAGAGGRGRAPLPTPVSTGRHGAAAAPAPVPGVNAAGHVVCSGAGKDYSGTMADVWGMGVILYRMVTGVLPFPADSMKSLRAMILKKPLTFPPLPAPQLSPNLQALIRRMLTLDPFARPAADEVMAQPWLASTGLGLLGGDDDDDDGNMVPEPPPVDPAATSAADAEVATAGVEDLIAAAAEVEGASARGRAAAKRGSPVRSRSRVSGIDTSAAAEAAGGGGTSPTSRAGGGGALEVVGSSRAGAVPTSRSEAPPSGRTPSAARSGSVAGWPMNDAVGLDDSASTDGVGGGGGGAGGDGEERISIVSSRAGLPPATTRSSSQMSLAEGGIAAAGGRGIRRSEVGAEARAMRRSSAGGGGGGGEEAGGGSGTPAGGSGVVLFGGLSGAGGKHPNLRRVSGINTSAPSPGVMAVGSGAPTAATPVAGGAVMQIGMTNFGGNLGTPAAGSASLLSSPPDDAATGFAPGPLAPSAFPQLIAMPPVGSLVAPLLPLGGGAESRRTADREVSAPGFGLGASPDAPASESSATDSQPPSQMGSPTAAGLPPRITTLSSPPGGGSGGSSPMKLPHHGRSASGPVLSPITGGNSGSGAPTAAGSPMPDTPLQAPVAPAAAAAVVGPHPAAARPHNFVPPALLRTLSPDVTVPTLLVTPSGAPSSLPSLFTPALGTASPRIGLMLGPGAGPAAGGAPTLAPAPAPGGTARVSWRGPSSLASPGMISLVPGAAAPPAQVPLSAAPPGSGAAAPTTSATAAPAPAPAPAAAAARGVGATSSSSALRVVPAAGRGPARPLTLQPAWKGSIPAPSGPPSAAAAAPAASGMGGRIPPLHTPSHLAAGGRAAAGGSSGGSGVGEISSVTSGGSDDAAGSTTAPGSVLLQYPAAPVSHALSGDDGGAPGFYSHSRVASGSAMLPSLSGGGSGGGGALATASSTATSARPASTSGAMMDTMGAPGILASVVAAARSEAAAAGSEHGTTTEDTYRSDLMSEPVPGASSDAPVVPLAPAPVPVPVPGRGTSLAPLSFPLPPMAGGAASAMHLSGAATTATQPGSALFRPSPAPSSTQAPPADAAPVPAAPTPAPAAAPAPTPAPAPAPAPVVAAASEGSTGGGGAGPSSSPGASSGMDGGADGGGGAGGGGGGFIVPSRPAGQPHHSPATFRRTLTAAGAITGPSGGSGGGGSAVGGVPASGSCGAAGEAHGDGASDCPPPAAAAVPPPTTEPAPTNDAAAAPAPAAAAADPVPVTTDLPDHSAPSTPPA